MKKICLLLVMAPLMGMAQNVMTPELLWSLGRINAPAISKDKRYLVFSVSTPNVAENRSFTKIYRIPLAGGPAESINGTDTLLENTHISADGKWQLSDAAVKIMNVYGSDFYPALQKSNAQVYNSLAYRHWDTWEDGRFNHVFLNRIGDTLKKDLMAGQPYDCPQQPFGGDEDYLFHPNSKRVVYVTKRKQGTEYALSTNTDIFEYNIETGETKNLTEGMMGYDINPAYNQKGQLAWLSMRRDGYEADKQDIMVADGPAKMNLTGGRDDIHAESFCWSDDGNSIYFIAPIDGTLQLFQVNYPGKTKMAPAIKQLTKGDFDVSSIVGEAGNKLYVTRTDFNHAAEVFAFDKTSGTLQQVTHINDETYSRLAGCSWQKRYVTTTDKQEMAVWLVLPPNFDSTKKYPALLYCQGGPQSPLTQFYSFRWNMHLMASYGYIVVAPCRRGMPGFGTRWNEAVSKDWGGQVIEDYLSAIDDASALPFVDTARRGAVGASFGGFSVFALAAVHNKRFKTFLSHDGVFDFRSMFGTTDELWFENWEKGGAYWDMNNATAQRSFAQSPSNFVQHWHTPIMIVQGGRDYRVPIEQGQQAFQAAQLRGIKSRFLYLPDENHWVLKPQNALVWQHEFFKWLAETLPATASLTTP